MNTEENFQTSRGKKICALALEVNNQKEPVVRADTNLSKLSCSPSPPGPSGLIQKSNWPTVSSEDCNKPNFANTEDESIEDMCLVVEIDDPELKKLVESHSVINLFNSIEVEVNNQEDVHVDAFNTIEVYGNNEEDVLEDAPPTNSPQSTSEVELTYIDDTNEKRPTNQVTNTVEELHIESTEGRPKKGRKRKFVDQTRAIKKRRVNTNQDYVAINGELKFCKDFREYICNCRLKCNTKIPVEKRKTVFTNFHNAGSFESRCLIIQGLVKEVPIKRKRVKNSEKKTVTREYYLCDELVCKAMFTQTLRVSSCVIDRALKFKRGNKVIADGRGRAGGHNKISEDKYKAVFDHIAKFPRYKSHYSRNKTEANYLNPEITLKVMYNLYVKENPENPVSMATYKNIFLTKFNLKRKPLKKDTCLVCDTAAVQIKQLTGEKLEAVKSKHDTHIAMAEEARELMEKHFKEAKDDNARECLSFDLEKTLSLPRIPTNIVYYKRQLCFYNLGIHDSKNKGFCYTWVEGTAGRGSQEVSSCLRKHILENVPPETTHLDFWSDSCGGQNRNIKMVLMLKSILEEHPGLETITQHFLVPGQTFLRNDSDFSDIECTLKLQQRLYVPDDYVHIIEKCRKKNPLIAIKMAKDDFLGTADLERAITNRKQSVEGEKVNWLQFRVVEVRKAYPMAFFVKNDLHQENYTEVYVLKKKGRKAGKSPQPNIESNYFSRKLIPLWPDGKAISTAKLADLKSMFTLIPKDCLNFYKSLVASNSVEDDIEGFNVEGDLDFEKETEDPEVVD